MATVDEKFRAFSDRTRLRILHLLLQGPMCVGDLITVLGLSQPKVSRHLAYLRKSGLVTAEKCGTWRHYALEKPRGRFHKELIACLSSCFSEVEELERDARLRKMVLKDGGCCPQACYPGPKKQKKETSR